MAVTNSTQHPKQEQDLLLDLWLKECAEFEELQKIKSTDAFNGFMICFKLRKWNASRFCDKTGLSGTMFSKIKKKSYGVGKFPSLQSVVAICVALQIPFDISMALLNHCGYSLSNTQRDRCYHFILTHYESFDIDRTNIFLMEQGFEPISDKDIHKNNISQHEKMKPPKSLKNNDFHNFHQINAVLDEISFRNAKSI